MGDWARATPLPQSPVSTVLAHELRSDWGWGEEGKTEIRDAKGHGWGPSSSQEDSFRKRRAEGRGERVARASLHLQGWGKGRIGSGQLDFPAVSLHAQNWPRLRSLSEEECHGLGDDG